MDINIHINRNELPIEAEIIELWSNYNAWNEPLFLNLKEENSTTFDAVLKFPLGGLLEFRFMYHCTEYTCSDYNMDHDNRCRSINWLTVKKKRNTREKKRKNKN